MKRIGIFGGTFDPVHWAHLYIADQAMALFQLEKIIFLPAADPPHKLKDSVTNFSARYDMLSLAVENNSKFIVSELEQQILQDRSYTVKTLEKLHELFPHQELFFIIGADSLFSMESWYRPQELFRLATFICFDRYDEGLIPMERQKMLLEENYGATIFLVDIINLDISSTFLRTEIQAGKQVRYLLPDKVLQYILTHNLYTAERTPHGIKPF